MVNELHLKFLKLFAIFGLAPYVPQMQQRRRRLRYHHHHQNTTAPHHHERRRIVRSQVLRWQQIYTVMLIILNLLLTLYGLVYIPFKDATIVSDLVSLIVFVHEFAVLVFVLAETTMSYDKYYEYFESLYHIQTLAKCLLQTQLCVPAVRQRQRRKYAIFVPIIYGCLIPVILTICLKYYYGYFWHALLAIFIIRTRCLQMVLALDYICYYLELLNRKFKALISCKIGCNFLYLDVDYRFLESYEYLENLKRVYDETYRLHEIYNRIFGLSLVGILSAMVLDITIHLYWTLLTLMNMYKSYFLFITISTLAPLTTILCVLCYAGEQCEKQCNLILVSLKCLLRTSLKASPNSMDYNALLQDFIMQILHNPIRISANDYFTLNLKFVMGIAANIVTYLVILLQFKKSSSTIESPNLNRTINNTTESSLAYSTNVSMPNIF